MVDDLDVETMNVLIEKEAMPNLQENIINKGTTFKNSFVTTSVCCPSRVTFLTGQYAHNHGVLTNLDISKFNDKSTLAVWLKDSGYRIGFVGKYLNFYGQYTEPTYIPPGWDDWNALIDPYTYRVYNYTINDNGILRNYGFNETEYQTDVIARISQKFIEDSEKKDDKQPFFLVIQLMAPHKELVTPLCDLNYLEFNTIRGPQRYTNYANKIQVPQPPSFNEFDLSDKPDYLQKIEPLNQKNIECLEKIFKGRIESMLAVDDLISVIIESLTINDESNNTIIIFTSDNGFLLGQHRLFTKTLPYEESIRVPLFIYTPGKNTPQSINHLVINNDLAPTIVEYAKANPDIKMDGRSLIPLMENPSYENWRNKFLIEHFSNIAGIHSAIRTESSILIVYKNSTEYYDLTSDPYQLDSKHDCKLSSCKLEIETLMKLLDELKTCKDSQCQILENK